MPPLCGEGGRVRLGPVNTDGYDAARDQRIGAFGSNFSE